MASRRDRGITVSVCSALPERARVPMLSRELSNLVSAQEPTSLPTILGGSCPTICPEASPPASSDTTPWITANGGLRVTLEESIAFRRLMRRRS